MAKHLIPGLCILLYAAFAKPAFPFSVFSLDTMNYCVDTLFSIDFEKLLLNDSCCSNSSQYENPKYVFTMAFLYGPRLTVGSKHDFYIISAPSGSIRKYTERGKLIWKQSFPFTYSTTIVDSTLYAFVENRLLKFELSKLNSPETLGVKFDIKEAMVRFVGPYALISNYISEERIIKYIYDFQRGALLKRKDGRFLPENGIPDQNIEKMFIGNGFDTVMTIKGESADYALFRYFPGKSGGEWKTQYVIFDKHTNKYFRLLRLQFRDIMLPSSSESNEFVFDQGGRIFFLSRRPQEKVISVCRLRVGCAE